MRGKSHFYILYFNILCIVILFTLGFPVLHKSTCKTFISFTEICKPVFKTEMKCLSELNDCFAENDA